LIEARETARKRRDFKKADEVRQQLAEGGIIVEDIRGGGVRWKRK
jgi:cysteinyl-tRNA synthetase